MLIGDDSLRISIRNYLPIWKDLLLHELKIMEFLGELKIPMSIPLRYSNIITIGRLRSGLATKWFLESNPSFKHVLKQAFHCAQISIQETQWALASPI